MAFQAIAIQMGVNLGMWALNKWVFNTDEKKQRPRPEGVEFPRTEIGTPIPLVYGSIRVDSPFIVWQGKSGTSWDNSAQTYRYFADLLMVIGTIPSEHIPYDWGPALDINNIRLRRMWYGDQETGSLALGHGNSAQLNINLGGAGAGGKMSQFIEFFDGRSNQLITSYPNAPSNKTDAAFMLHPTTDRSLVPGYRQQMVVSLTNGGFSSATYGENPRLASIGFEVSVPGYEPIDANSSLPLANPAWVIYDLTINTVWRIGMSADDVDLASFQACATVLQTEGHGVGLTIANKTDAGRVIANLCEQVDGVLYVDPKIGKIKMRLIRKDYGDPLLLPAITKSNLIGEPRVQWKSWDDAANFVTVKYMNRNRGYKHDTMQSPRMANALGQDNRMRGRDVDYPACVTAAQAAKLAAREMSQGGRPIMTISCKVNREHCDRVIGDAVLFTDATYNISNVVFRVIDIDLGTLGGPEISLSLVEDVFDDADGDVVPPLPPTVIDLLPMTERFFDEAPYHLIYQEYAFGGISSLTDTRIFAGAVREGDAAQLVDISSHSGIVPGDYVTPFHFDTSVRGFDITAKVAIAYAREKEPYDTATGLVLDTISDETTLAALAADAGDIESNGKNLVLVGTELMSFESATSLGGGQVRLNNVWRGLCDTVPVDHKVGERVYMVSTLNVGHRAWTPDRYLMRNAVPVTGGFSGSGDEADDELRVQGRVLRELRAADLRAAGYIMTGTLGIPAISESSPYLGDFKSVSDVDEAVDLKWRQNERNGQFVRGDSPIWIVAGGTTWDVYVQKDGESEIAVTGQTGLAQASIATSGVLLGQAGHGMIDVVLYTKNSGNRSWQSPRIRCTARRWRSLLANASAQYNALSPGWSNTVGTVSVQSGTSSLSLESTGRWFQPATAVDGATEFRQTIDVSGYRPKGLTTAVDWYFRNFSGDTDDNVKLKIEWLTASDSVLESVTSSAFVGPLTHWRRESLELETIETTAAKLRITVIFQSITNAVALVGVTRIHVRIGHDASQLLLNPSFDSTFTSWTNVLNSFTADTTTQSMSDDGTMRCARGGAFANSEIKQEVSVPAGFEYGDAVLEFARLTSIAGDTGEVVLEVLNGGGSLIASATTGATAGSVLSIWSRGRLSVTLPDDSVTLRVRLLAVRTGGAGDSGAVFDDFDLRIHKHLDATTTKELNFGSPKRQPLPPNWQQFHLDFPTLPIPIAWDGLSPTPTARPSQLGVAPYDGEWSDGSAHTAGVFIAHIDERPAVASSSDDAFGIATDAFVFTRQAAVSAVDIQISDGNLDTEFDLADPFTVAVCFRTDELLWGGACGLAGRRDNAGLGWGLQIDSTGHVVAVLQGASGTVSNSTSTTVHDRAPHWAFIVNDPVAQKLGVYDERGGSEVLATTTGSISPAAGTVMRIGRDGPASQTLPGMIARVYKFRDALTPSQIADICRVGKDPSGLLSAWTSDRAVWIHGPNDNNANATLVRCSADHIPVAYDSALDTDGDGYALATAAANTNACPTHDFADTTRWAKEHATNVSLTHGVVDATGLARGVTVLNSVANQGIRLTDIPMTAGGFFGVIVYAKAASAINVDAVLLDSNGSSKGNVTMPLTTKWQRFVMLFGWDNTTPTGIVRFAPPTSTGVAFSLCHVVWCGRANQDISGDFPLVIQDAALAISDTFGRVDFSWPRQLNYEGEVYVEGRAQSAAPWRGSTLAIVDNNSNQNNKRRLGIDSTGVKPTVQIYDNAGTPVDTEATAIDWSQVWKIRGRWNRYNVPEGGAVQQGIVVDGSADSAAYEANAFSVGTTVSSRIRVGGDASNQSGNLLLRKVIVRTREPKLT
jgi:hypothetical protein